MARDQIERALDPFVEDRVRPHPAACSRGADEFGEQVALRVFVVRFDGR